MTKTPIQRCLVALGIAGALSLMAGGVAEAKKDKGRSQVAKTRSKHDHGSSYSKRRGGPPSWAPAHGYRRKTHTSYKQSSSRYRDSDHDGIPDYRDTRHGTNWQRTRTRTRNDRDGDGIPNARDRDDDNDGIPDGRDRNDRRVNTRRASRDTDGDGVPNYRDRHDNNPRRH